MKKRAGGSGDDPIDARIDRLIKQLELLSPSEGKDLITTVLQDVSAFADLRVVVPEDEDELKAQGLKVVGSDGVHAYPVVAPTQPFREKFRRLLDDELEALETALATAIDAESADPMGVAEEDQPSLSQLTEISDSIRQVLITELTDLREMRAPAAPAVTSQLVAMQRSLQHDLQESQRRRTVTEERERSTQQVRENRRAWAEAEGKRAASRLAQHFEKYSSSALREARFWQFVTVSVLSFSVWSTYEHIASAAGLDWLDIAQRLTVALPVALLVTFSVGEASIHRHHGMWARHLSVQLKTVRAFTEEWPPDEMVELRTAVGKRAFESPPEPKSAFLRRRSRQSDEKSSLSEKNIMALVELLKSARPE